MYRSSVNLSLDAKLQHIRRTRLLRVLLDRNRAPNGDPGTEKGHLFDVIQQKLPLCVEVNAPLELPWLSAFGLVALYRSNRYCSPSLGVS
jgi:hypothetical protein